MKKAFEFLTNWVEVSFIILLVLGFGISLLINDVYISYGIVLLSGLVSGKIIYHKKKDYLFPYIILIAGFILGYIIGHRQGSAMAIILIFGAGNILCYYAHKKLKVL
jgi:hypothetical protein